MRRRKPTDHTGERIADAGVWHAVAAGLTPVIGALGFAALFGRSLLAASADFPWLASIDAAGSDRLEAYERALAARPRAMAAAAQAAVQRTFAQLLEHLVGKVLAQRLLRDQLEDLPSPPRRRASTKR